MVSGLRVVFSPNPVSRGLYSYPVPEPGAHGTVTAARTASGLRTYVHGPGGGLVYVEWDGDGLVCGVSMRDLMLEPDEGEPAGQECAKVHGTPNACASAGRRHASQKEE